MRSLAFTGAHSSGKSTLIKALVGQNLSFDVSVIDGITRAIIERGFPLAKNSTVDSYTNYIRDQLQAERRLRAAEPDILITDRTVLDAASYAFVNSELPRPFVPQYFVEMLLEVALLEAHRFDLFVYCPVEFPMEQDEVRPYDESYRAKVGLRVKSMLDKHRIPYVTAAGNVQKRLRVVNQALGDLDE